MKTIVEILIDNSGSMGYMKGAGKEENKYLIGGKTRMSFVKDLMLSEIIPTIDYATSIVIRTFRMDFEEVDHKIIHRSPDIKMIYEGKYDRPLIEAKIKALPDPPMGGTPIAAALEKAYKNLKNYPGHDRKIILLTDGEENAGGDYIHMLRKIEVLDGIPCKIFIIGVSLDEKAVTRLKELATGGFYNITSNVEKESLRRVLAHLKMAVLKDSINKMEQPGHSTYVSGDQESKIKSKIVTVKKDVDAATHALLDSLGKNIMEYISTGEKLLSDLSTLKESLRADTLLEARIDATTLTLDEDYSEDIRQKSELLVYRVLCERYGEHRVNWLNKQAEKYAPYDFEILNDQKDVVRYVDCKGTVGEKPTFYMSDREWHFFLENRDKYQIYRVYNIDSTPQYICLENLLESLLAGKVVPYLTQPEILKENRVFLTLNSKKLRNKFLAYAEVLATVMLCLF